MPTEEKIYCDEEKKSLFLTHQEFADPLEDDGLEHDGLDQIFSLILGHPLHLTNTNIE